MGGPYFEQNPEDLAAAFQERFDRQMSESQADTWLPMEQRRILGACGPVSGSGLKAPDAGYRLPFWPKNAGLWLSGF